MAKLVEILARELKEWPEGVDCLGQWPSGAICNIKKNRQGSHDRIGRVSMSDDEEDVTRAQWEAERARIAANQQATAEAREIARTGAMTTEAQELADIACGKRSREDQALWDKVAIGWIAGAAADPATSWFDEGLDALITCSCNVADAFMAERAKRTKQAS